MNIGCFLLIGGMFKEAIIPEELIIKLLISLRENGEEVVHFADKSLLVEGVYIPAKGSNTTLLALPEQ